MKLRAIALGMVALVGIVLLGLVCWSYAALGPVWLTQALPWCS